VSLHFGCVMLHPRGAWVRAWARAGLRGGGWARSAPALANVRGAHEGAGSRARRAVRAPFCGDLNWANFLTRLPVRAVGAAHQMLTQLVVRDHGDAPSFAQVWRTRTLAHWPRHSSSHLQAARLTLHRPRLDAARAICVCVPALPALSCAGSGQPREGHATGPCYGESPFSFPLPLPLTR